MTTNESAPRLAISLSIGLLAASLLLAGTASLAEDGLQATGNDAGQQQYQGKRKPNWERLARKMQLDDAQTDAFVDIMRQQHEQRVQAREESGLDERMQEIDADVEQQLAEVLDAQQLARFIDHRERRRMKRMKNR